MFWFRKRSSGRGIRRHLTLARYDLLLPRGYTERRSSGNGTDDEEQEGLGLGMFSFSAGSSSGANTSPSSPTSTSPPSSGPPSPTAGHLSLLPLPFDLRPASPALSTTSASSERTSAAAATADAFRRAGTWVVSVPSFIANSRAAHSRHNRSGSRSGAHGPGRGSFVALLPAIFTPAPPRRHHQYRDDEESGTRRSHHHPQRSASPSPPPGLSSGHRPSPLSLSASRGVPKDISTGILIDLEAGAGSRPHQASTRPQTPLLMIDPLEGSDVRTTRSDSISVAVSEGMPPPYRGGSGSNGVVARSLSGSMSAGERGRERDLLE